LDRNTRQPTLDRLKALSSKLMDNLNQSMGA
jgi:hypothetical protein